VQRLHISSDTTGLWKMVSSVIGMTGDQGHIEANKVAFVDSLILGTKRTY